MPATLRDRFTPTAVGIVSRAWVIREVERDVEPYARAGAIDALVSYEPPRPHAMRNNLIFWVGVLGATMLAAAAGVPGWIGFAAALVFFAAIARTLAVRALRWRLRQWKDERAGG